MTGGRSHPSAEDKLSFGLELRLSLIIYMKVRMQKATIKMLWLWPGQKLHLCSAPNLGTWCLSARVCLRTRLCHMEPLKTLVIGFNTVNH